MSSCLIIDAVLSGAQKYINAQDNKGNTPLHIFFLRRIHVWGEPPQDTATNTIANILLKYGADPNIQNNSKASIAAQ
jgi:hypothetical protein